MLLFVGGMLVGTWEGLGSIEIGRDGTVGPVRMRGWVCMCVDVDVDGGGAACEIWEGEADMHTSVLTGKGLMGFSIARCRFEMPALEEIETIHRQACRPLIEAIEAEQALVDAENKATGRRCGNSANGAHRARLEAQRNRLVEKMNELNRLANIDGKGRTSQFTKRKMSSVTPTQDINFGYSFVIRLRNHPRSPKWVPKTNVPEFPGLAFPVKLLQKSPFPRISQPIPNSILWGPH